MKKIILALALLTGACDIAQSAIDDADMICRDGVEYMAYSKMNSSGTLSYSVVPHFKPDGTLFTCVRKVEK